MEGGFEEQEEGDGREKVTLARGGTLLWSLVGRGRTALCQARRWTEGERLEEGWKAGGGRGSRRAFSLFFFCLRTSGSL